jgi:hypothetical protein
VERINKEEKKGYVSFSLSPLVAYEDHVGSNQPAGYSAIEAFCCKFSGALRHLPHCCYSKSLTNNWVVEETK